MSSDQFAIRVQNLSKCYQIYDRPQDRLKQSMLPRLHRLMGGESRAYYREFWALKNISFEVNQGETLGIIGRNGSGKSTLLQVIAGTLSPTRGEARVQGRVAALLELGAGFNPEFTGRENVYMNAAILGLTKDEIDQRYDRIAEFAAIGDFLEQPIKTYSSGMYARLAFAVAINVDPDILVVDEALSVGDEAFQRKCFGRIQKIKERGATVLFVSHSAGTVIDLCDRTVLLDGGERLLTGQPKTAVSLYQRLLYATPERVPDIRRQIIETDRSQDQASRQPVLGRHGPFTGEPVVEREEYAEYDPSLQPSTTVEYMSKGVTIRDVRILDNRNCQVNVLVPGQVYRYSYIADFHKTCAKVRFGMLFKTTTGVEIAGQVSHVEGDGVEFVGKGNSVEVTFSFQNRFLSGTYFGNAGVLANDEEGQSFMHRLLDAIMFRVKPTTATGAVPTVLIDLKPSGDAKVSLRVSTTGPTDRT